MKNYTNNRGIRKEQPYSVLGRRLELIFIKIYTGEIDVMGWDILSHRVNTTRLTVYIKLMTANPFLCGKHL